jgi:hypothetical protein
VAVYTCVGLQPLADLNVLAALLGIIPNYAPDAADLAVLDDLLRRRKEDARKRATRIATRDVASEATDSFLIDLVEGHRTGLARRIG